MRTYVSIKSDFPKEQTRGAAGFGLSAWLLDSLESRGFACAEPSSLEYARESGCHLENAELQVTVGLVEDASRMAGRGRAAA